MTSVIDINVHETSYQDATSRICTWAKAGESRAVYATSVHGAVEAHDYPEFRKIINRADLITPDGMPLVWMLRLKGIRNQQRVYGPTLMLHVLEMAARELIPVGFYGGKRDVLDSLNERMKSLYPSLQVNYAFNPPFRELSEAETNQVQEEIIQSGARILFVGLGCPRQETWIDSQRGVIPAVMIGVGAAFDFHAGQKPQAPLWLQKSGLEWFFSLLSEPHRLWRRYFSIVPRFLLYAVVDLLGWMKKVN